MASNDGGPAHPIVWQDAPYGGMSLRDYFAGQAMAAILSLGRGYTYQGGMTPAKEASLDAYTMADAMLAARTEAAPDA